MNKFLLLIVTLAIAVLIGCFIIFFTIIPASNSFTFIKSEFTEEELQLFETFTVSASEEYSRFGELHLLRQEIPQFLAKLGSNSTHQIQLASTAIIKLIDKVLTESKQETAWVVIRASIPNNRFKVPRWHMDGNYYHPYNTNFPKFIMTLKGPQTLFYPANTYERSQVNKHGDTITNSDDRSYLANLLDTKKIVSPQRGDGAFFIVGNEETAAVHSEPDITEPRLFIALVLGSNQQIAELQQRLQPRSHQNFRFSPEKNNVCY